MRALFGNVAVFQHINAMRAHNGGKSVSDNQHGFVFNQLIQRFLLIHSDINNIA